MRKQPPDDKPKPKPKPMRGLVPSSSRGRAPVPAPLPPPAPASVPARPQRRIERLAPNRTLRKKVRGKYFYGLILAKGYRQSSFARAAAKHKKDGVLGRDLVSRWCQGTALPDALNEDAIAKTLGISVEELMAPIYEGTIETNEIIPPFEITGLEGGLARLTINMTVPWDVAQEVFRLLSVVK